MQITSLTDFPSKQAHIYMIKVSFLSENKSRSGEQVKGRTGAGGSKQGFTEIILQDRRGHARQQPSALALFAPNLIAVQGGPPRTWAQRPPAAHFL